MFTTIPDCRRTMRQAQLAGGLAWEHYHSDWSVDREYNRNDITNIFRPWGYQPGHLTERAKLLLILERHKDHLEGDTAWKRPLRLTPSFEGERRIVRRLACYTRRKKKTQRSLEKWWRTSEPRM